MNYAIEAAGKQEATGTERHVTGQEVLEGMRVFGLQIFGPLTAQVWRSWGVKESMDWGRIVFLLVDHGLLNRQESDTIEDFRNGFDFDAVFVKAYRPSVPGDLADSAGALGASED